MPNMIKKAFTLIELLVVISIIGILVAVSIFGLSGAREASRDAKRKSDLETIRSGLELYRADCGTYPIGSSLPSSLIGTKVTGNVCLTSDTYITSVPVDPSTQLAYIYSGSATGYQITATLEQSGAYIVTNP